jgi:hypothetical protein
MRTLLVLFAMSCCAAAQKYAGPKPPKADVIYLLHADSLVPTEIGEAKEETSKKDDSVFTIAAASSTAKTPLPEPIFILQTDKLDPQRIELYKMDVKDGRREVLIRSKKKAAAVAIPMTVKPLADHLFRLEANQPLENGQYSLSPNDSNRVFCFEVY